MELQPASGTSRPALARQTAVNRLVPFQAILVASALPDRRFMMRPSVKLLMLVTLVLQYRKKRYIF